MVRHIRRKRPGLLCLMPWCCLALLVLCCSINTPMVHGLSLRPRRQAPVVELTPQEEEQALAKQKRAETIWKSMHLLTDVNAALYGTILVLYAQKHYSGQVLIMTVMRAAGYSRLERALREFRKNIRQTIRSTLFHAPSLLLAKRAIFDLQKRKETAQSILYETWKAKKDGTVTKKEERQIRKLQKRQVKSINRDIRRIQRGSSSIAKLWRTLDVQEIMEILRRLIFMGTAVLASGHSISHVGRAISTYCHFWSLGQVLTETNRKVGLPLSRWIITSTIDPMAMTIQNRRDPTRPSQLRVLMGTTIMYMVAAILILFRYSLGVKLNAALLAATLTTRGVVSTLAEIQNWDKDDEDEQDNDEMRDVVITWRQGTLQISEFGMGLATIFLAIVALYCGSSLFQHDPPLLLKPLLGVEKVIDKLVVLADKL